MKKRNFKGGKITLFISHFFVGPQLKHDLAMTTDSAVIDKNIFM